MAKAKDIRRSFSEEFKLESVRRIEGRPEGVSVSHIARELGVRPDMLREWARRFKALADPAPRDVAAGRGRHPRMNEELKRLERENARLKQENDFLKKAAAFFAQEVR